MRAASPILRSASLTQKILSDRHFNIEFQGYLSNHAKHGIIALERLKASEARIQEWWDGYTNETPYALVLEPAEWERATPCTSEDWKNLKGLKKDWTSMCLFLEKELKENHQEDVRSLVKTYATLDLLEGMTGALTHGIIHLGWALDAEQNPWMTIEGLAYLNFCNLGVDREKLVESAREEETMLESLQRVCCTWNEEDLAQTWIQAAKAKYDESFHPELVPAGFQWQLAKVIEEAHPVATELPSWLQTTSLEQLWEDLYRTVVAVYLATRSATGNGDFLVLHAISSLWGLEKVCRVIEDDDLTRKALGYYYSMLICLLATKSGGFPDYNQVEKVVQSMPPDSIDSDDFDWTHIDAAGIAEDEEHNIKLTYVCKELWKRYGQWRGFSEAAKSFTLTPQIGPTTTSFKS